MIRKSLAIAAAFAFTILLPSPAQAGLRWEGDHPVVLVYAPVPTQWGVGKAVTQWNKSGAAITLQISAQPCTGCITVEEGTTPDASGSAELHHLIGQSTFLHCRIRLDPLYRDTGLRAHGIAAHEVGHCLGLPHNRAIWSVMNPDSAQWLDRPSPADLRRVNRIYQETS